MTIADRMAIFREGEIIQIGTPDDVFNRPDDMDVAGFIGSPPMNLLPARLSDGGVRGRRPSRRRGDRLRECGHRRRPRHPAEPLASCIRRAAGPPAAVGKSRREHASQRRCRRRNRQGPPAGGASPRSRRDRSTSPSIPHTSISSIPRPAAASTAPANSASFRGLNHENRLPAFRFAQPADARALWRRSPQDAELQAPRRALRDLRQALYRVDALHAGAARHADRSPHLPAPQLGAAGALRQLLSGTAEDDRAPIRT